MDDNYYYYDDSSDTGFGNPAGGGSQQELRRIEGFLEDDIRAFVGGNSDKYLDRFYCISRGQKPYNWCSALFFCYWLIYRKMWKHAIAFTVILSLLSSAAANWGLISQGVFYLAELVFLFGYMGREGNVFYWNYVKEELTKEGLANIPQPDYEKRSRLAAKGGTSILFLICLIIFDTAFSRILSFLF